MQFLQHIDLVLNLVLGVLFLFVGLPAILRTDQVRNLPLVPKVALLVCSSSFYGIAAFGSLLVFHGELWKWPFVYCVLSIFVSTVLFIFTRPR